MAKVSSAELILLFFIMTSVFGCAVPLNNGYGGGVVQPVLQPSNNVCSILAGVSVVANDGQYLGLIASAYEAKSLLNEFGNHGNEYNQNSIWNTYGKYGGEYSTLSPFNSYTTTPPMLIKNGKVIGYLTTNDNISNGVNPFVLKTCEFY